MKRQNKQGGNIPNIINNQLNKSFLIIILFNQSVCLRTAVDSSM